MPYCPSRHGVNIEGLAMGRVRPYRLQSINDPRDARCVMNEQIS